MPSTSNPKGLISCILPKKDLTQIFCIGLDGAGKSTLLHKLRVPKWEAADMQPTLKALRQYHEWDESSGPPEGVVEPGGAEPVLLDFPDLGPLPGTETAEDPNGSGATLADAQGPGGSTTTNTKSGTDETAGAGSGTLSQTAAANTSSPQKQSAESNKKYGYIADCGFNYDIICSKSYDVGFWDIPGISTSSLIRLWQCFYQQIQYHAIFYVVSSAETPERLAKCRRHLEILLCEEELRFSCFVLLINSKRDTPYDVERDPFYSALGLYKLSKRDKARCKHFVVDFMNLKSVKDPMWLQILDYIRKTIDPPKDLDK